MQTKDFSFKRLSTPGRLALLFAFTGFAVVAVLAYGYMAGSRIVTKYTPLMDAAMEIKIEGTTFHLWVEEYIVKDPTLDAQEIWIHLDKAKGYARAMLEGGGNPYGAFAALDDAGLRAKITQVVEALNQFEAITRERMAAMELSAAGSRVEQRYDDVFNAFIQQADEVETRLRQWIAADLKTFNHTLVAMIMTCLVIFLLFAGTAFLYEKGRKMRLAEIRLANTRLQAEIEKHIQTGQALDAEKKRLAVTLRSIGDAVISTDLAGKVDLMNPVAEHLTGWPLAEARGVALADVFRIFNEKNREPCANPFEKVMETGRVVGLANNTLLIGRNGRERIIADSGAPILDKTGKMLGVVLVFRDITEQVHLENELRHAYKMEAIGTLSGGIAHEFNNILSIVLGNAELALDSASDRPQVDNALREILAASLRGKDIVSQLLNFSRKGNQEPIPKGPIDLCAVVREAFNLLRAVFPADIVIEQDLPRNPRMIMGDTTQLHQVVLNLCTNAVHAMEEAGGKLSITVSSVHTAAPEVFFHQVLAPGDYICLQVTDTGHGIPDGLRERVFDPFYSTRETNKGSGMGLSVVLGIIDSHDGGIRITSRQGQGTRVECFFPAVPVLPEKKSTGHQAPSGGKETILVVDDEPALVNLIKLQLSRLGYQVFAHTDPMKVLNRFREAPDAYDLVITDMSMPQITGDKLVEEMIRVRPDIKTIIFSGYSEKLEYERARRIGASACIMKPIEGKLLARTVRQVLDQTDPSL